MSTDRESGAQQAKKLGLAFQSALEDYVSPFGKKTKPVPARTVRNNRLDFMTKWMGREEFAALRAKLFPRTSKQPEDLALLLCELGMDEFIWPINNVMKSLAIPGKTRPTKSVVPVPTNRILSKVWCFYRLKRLFKISPTGTKPPPVELHEIRFGTDTFYLVSSGNHRTEAARIQGKEFIEAEIRQISCFNPGDWVLVKEGTRNRVTGEIISMKADQRSAARWLGVKSH